MYSETTRSIIVTVKPFYLENQSSPAHRISVRTASSASFRVGRRTAVGCRERGSGAEKGGATTCDIKFSLGVLEVCARESGRPRLALS